MNSFCTHLVLTLIQSVPRIKLSLVKINPFWTKNILGFNPSCHILLAIRTLVFFKLVKPSLPLTMEFSKEYTYVHMHVQCSSLTYGENNAIFLLLVGLREGDKAT